MGKEKEFNEKNRQIWLRIEDAIEVWWDYIDQKEMYENGLEKIDIDNFKKLLKESYFAIKDAKEAFYTDSGNIFKIIDRSSENREIKNDCRLFFSYVNLVSQISRYSADTSNDDLSDNHLFSITFFLTGCLASFGSSDDFIDEHDILHYPVNEGKILTYSFENEDLTEFIEYFKNHIQ